MKTLFALFVAAIVAPLSVLLVACTPAQPLTPQQAWTNACKTAQSTLTGLNANFENLTTGAQSVVTEYGPKIHTLCAPDVSDFDGSIQSLETDVLPALVTLAATKK